MIAPSALLRSFHIRVCTCLIPSSLPMSCPILSKSLVRDKLGATYCKATPLWPWPTSQWCPCHSSPVLPCKIVHSCELLGRIKLHARCFNHKLIVPPPVIARFRAPTPVGSLSRTARPLPTHPSSMASSPPRSIAGLPAPRASLEEPMSFSMTQQTKRDATAFDRVRGVSRMTRRSSARRRKLLPECSRSCGQSRMI